LDPEHIRLTDLTHRQSSTSFDKMTTSGLGAERGSA
jgi:hypothetical protein